jgi:hypothetical protein
MKCAPGWLNATAPSSTTRQHRRVPANSSMSLN